jgi:hypothetical protein
MLFSAKKAKKTYFSIYFNFAQEQPPSNSAKTKKLPCGGKLFKEILFSGI